MQDQRRPVLLAIVEFGGYPDFSDLYRDSGFDVAFARSTREAVAFLNRTAPAVIVCEFNFGPIYGDRISNLEALLGKIQARSPSARLIVFAERERLDHLERLRPRFPIFEVLCRPIERTRLETAVRRAATSA